MPYDGNHGKGLYLGDAFAVESVTVAATAIGGTGATYAPASGPAEAMTFSVETASVRYWMDGTDPTAALGHEVLAGERLTIIGIDNISKLRWIRTGSTSATVRCTYFR